MPHPKRSRQARLPVGVALAPHARHVQARHPKRLMRPAQPVPRWQHNVRWPGLGARDQAARLELRPQTSFTECQKSNDIPEIITLTKSL